MRYTNIKKASPSNIRIKQQQQTLITSATLCPFKKKQNNSKFKIASDEVQTKQNNLYITRKDMGPDHNKAW